MDLLSELFVDRAINTAFVCEANNSWTKAEYKIALFKVIWFRLIDNSEKDKAFCRGGYNTTKLPTKQSFKYMKLEVKSYFQ